MANTKSAEKRIRSSERRREYNLKHRGNARTQVKKARIALESGKVDEAVEAVKIASGALDHAASKGVIHKNNASRRKGRLMKKLATLQAK